MTDLAVQTLHLVARELAATLNETRLALEAFEENPQDSEPLLRVADLLHQARGVLRVVEVYGAALLAEEMEFAARFLATAPPEKQRRLEGVDALMRAAVQLPNYLERVLAGGRDLALVLLPLLNDLRAVRGSALLSEGTLLLLNLTSDRQPKGQPHDDSGVPQSLVQAVRRLRPRYQVALLGWIRDEYAREHLSALADVAEKLERLAATREVFQLWWVVGAVIEALRDGGLEAGATTKRLLGQADREMRRLFEQGETRYADNPPIELLNNLLYYVARTTSNGPRVTSVRKSFRLAELLPVDDSVEQERESLSAPSVNLMKTVAAAIKEDLGRVKDALDIFTRKGGQPGELTGQVDLLKKIGDTLAVLGLGSLRERVQGQIERLGAIAHGSSPPDHNLLVDTAAVLIGVEDALDDGLVQLIMPPGAPAAIEPQDPEFRQVAEAVLRECIVNLARIKETVTSALATPAESSVLDQVQPLARGITAGLLMLGKARAVDIMSRIGRHVVDLSKSGIGCRGNRIDRLADAIVSIEYYMETLQAGRSDPWYMLDNAERCLQALETREDTISPAVVPGAQPERTLVVERREPAENAPSTPDEAAFVKTVPQLIRLHPGVPPAPAVGAPAATVPPGPPVERVAVADEFVVLFIEEAREEVATIERLFPLWAENASDEESLKRIRRSFHTLKGSGRMVGAHQVGEFSWVIENLLNRIIDGTLPRSPGMLALLRECVAAVPRLIDALEAGRPALVDAEGLEARARAYAEGREPEIGVAQPVAPEDRAAPGTEIPRHDRTLVLTGLDESAVRRMLDQVPPAPAEGVTPPDGIAVTSSSEASGVALLLEPTLVAPRDGELAPDVAEEKVIEPDHAPLQMDPALHEIYAKEVEGYLQAIRSYIDRARMSPPPYQVTEALYRACHTLSGASKTADARHCVRLAEPLHRWLRRLHDHQRGLDAHGLAVLEDAVATFGDVVRNINEDTGFFVGLKEFARHVESLDGALERELALEAATAAAPAALSSDSSVDGSPEPVLTDGDGSAGPASIGDGGVPEAAFGVERPPQAAEGWLGATNAVEMTELPAMEPGAGLMLSTESDSTDRVPDVCGDDAHGAEEATGAGVAPCVEPVTSVVEQVSGQADSDMDRVEQTPALAGRPGDDADEFDPDIAAIFCEEATELLEAGDSALGALRVDRSSEDRLTELRRVLHTLKGGARMAGIRAMGNLSHELESLLTLAGGGQARLDEPFFGLLQESLDELSRMRDLVSSGRRPTPAHELAARIHRVARGEIQEAPSEATAELQSVVEQPAAFVSDVAAVAADSFDGFDEVSAGPVSNTELVVSGAVETPVSPPHEDLPVDTAAGPTIPAAPVAAQAQGLPGREAPAERAEMARVDADLLDSLLNNAGEVSIFRSRLEQQLTSVEFNLGELSRVVQRFKDQLRKLEIEVEGQILHRHVDARPHRPDFDPLEFDRYSSIQQYARALAETAADVGSVQQLIENLTRDAQGLLTQQGRVVTELQTGLMRTRMVPFQRHVQRLTRIVRQTAADSDKKAELVVNGAAGELDRQVLERMLPPLEHLLRNAIVHGIELPAGRRACGKPETGRISIALHREGAEVLIDVEDDGSGINLRAVREKAIGLGMISPRQDLSDDEALQLILEPGFSTASLVTQAAGRGVGMDVVATEVKKLGGMLVIHTKPGVGTRFTVRLPFTLAISQALIVRVGDEIYALPLQTVEGVVRTPKSEVQRRLADDTSPLEYGGQKYRFQSLGSFVGGSPLALPEQDVAMPVILIRAGEHSAAVVADELLGSREIVVKSVGPQIAGIRGISGATVLGDGRICIILDMGALVRSEWRARSPVDQRSREHADQRVFALVVDDSITVRRVTQRLLERNGMRVMTARDGLDAVALLQEHVPDIILLDIEMPRMDGYEVASHVRNDPRLHDVPIVMITSRVGEKHRARAIELGVDDYLGKPYQESQLLEAMQPLIRRRREAVS
ncbi:MAG: Hpt domain-containing protein [Steroidobacteraceae bacterium]